MKKFIERKDLQEIQEYEFRDIKEYDPNVMLKNAVVYIGTAFKTQDKKKFIISPTLFSKKKVFYEFNIDDLLKWEEIDNIVDNEGHTIIVVKAWIKEGAKGIKHEPFIVE